MRLVRFSLDGQTWHLGAEDDGHVVRLPQIDVVELIRAGNMGMEMAKEAVREAQAAPTGRDSNKVIPIDQVRIGAPIVNPPKIVCIGLNYRDHAAESKMQVPSAPILFAKFPTAIVGPDDPVLIPPITSKVDYEAELVVVIGKGGKEIAESDALYHVFGYTIMNDMSARDLQFEDGQWLKGKTLDTFAPLGPAIVTADEIPDPQSLRVTMKRNGRTVQDAPTSDMIFTVRYLVHYLSNLFTLEPGDVIATGTPPGVILGKEDPDWLQPGEVLEASIDPIGVLRNELRAVGD